MASLKMGMLVFKLQVASNNLLDGKCPHYMSFSYSSWGPMDPAPTPRTHLLPNHRTAHPKPWCWKGWPYNVANAKAKAPGNDVHCKSLEWEVSKFMDWKTMEWSLSFNYNRGSRSSLNHAALKQKPLTGEWCPVSALCLARLPCCTGPCIWPRGSGHFNCPLDTKVGQIPVPTVLGRQFPGVSDHFAFIGRWCHLVRAGIYFGGGS